MKRIFLMIAMSAVYLASAGCVTTPGGISDEKIIEKTGYALDLNPGTFTIKDRKNDGDSTYYHVRTNSGKVYNCNITSSSSFIYALEGQGRTISSDPICTKTR